MSRFLDQVRKAKEAREQAAQKAAASEGAAETTGPAVGAPPGEAARDDADVLFPDMMDTANAPARLGGEHVTDQTAAPLAANPAGEAVVPQAARQPQVPEPDYDLFPEPEPASPALGAVADNEDFAALDALERIVDAQSRRRAVGPQPPAEATVRLPVSVVPAAAEAPEPARGAVAPEAAGIVAAEPTRPMAAGPTRSVAPPLLEEPTRQPTGGAAARHDEDLFPPELTDRELPSRPGEGVEGHGTRDTGLAANLGEPSAIRVSRRTRRSRSETPVPGPEADPAFVVRIPRVALRPDKRVLSYYEPENHVCEEYRLLGKNLLHTLAATAGDPKLGKIVTLSSSARGEGKTLTCVNLANTLSQDLRDRVLLVDADLRHPKVSRYLGVPTSRGLNDLLASDDPASILEDCLLRTDTGLHLLTSAALGNNPAPLLDSERMVRILELVRQRYSVAIMDTPPVLLATDALTLGVRSDGMLLLLRARKTQREQVQEARQRIARLEIRMLGYVINNVRSFLPRIWRKYYNYNY